MARYNTVTPTGSITTGSTIIAPQSGTLITLTGTAPYTVTLANPTLYTGQTQSFWNNSGGNITLSSPSGNIKGNGFTTATSQTLVNQAFISITSDGTDYVITSNDGGPLKATTGSFSSTLDVTGNTTLTGDVAINGGDITTTATSFNLVNGTATTLNIGGAATTLALGATSGTATIANSTLTLSNATTVNVNGANPSLVCSSTGTLTLFNTNATTVNAFGAATTLSIGSASSATTFNGTLNIASGKTYKINNTDVLSATTLGSGVTSSSLTSVGTLTSLTTSGKIQLTFDGPGTTLTDSGSMLELQDNGATSAPAMAFHRPGAYATTIRLWTDNYLYFGGWSAAAGGQTVVFGTALPGATNSYDLGSTSLRWRNIYTQDLHLSNGIGDYTMVEGEENLYLVNNKNGKSYKFALIEVPADEVPPKSEA